MIATSELLELVWAQSWQLTALVAVVVVMVGGSARRRAHLAYVLWLVVLLKCLTPPWWSAPTGVFCWLRSAEMAGDASASDARRAIPRSPARGDPIVEHALAPLPRAAFPSAAPIVGHAAPPAASQAEDEESFSWTATGSLLGRCLISVWSLGIGLILLVSLVRWRLFLRRLHRMPTCLHPQLAALVGRLARELRVRQRVRLLVTDSRIGPAVIGLLRPTILLPDVIVRGKSPDDLAPILAHELIHVRRGDLWCGLLQLASRALWWFHPLVWLATRAAAREAERCCDEEVLAELQCGPARYARSLLEVLEQKVRLQAVPTFPGVRAMDVTTKRLERIMRIGQACRRRTPWWCWLVLVLVSLMALPGESLGVARKKKHRQPAPPPAASSESVAAAQDHTAADVGQRVRTYAVDDLMRRIEQQFQVSEDGSRITLQQVLTDFVGRPTRDEPEMQFHWSDRNVTVHHTPEGHARFQEAIGFFREHGFQEMCTEVVVISGPLQNIEALPVAWLSARFPADQEQEHDGRPPEDLLAAAAADSAENHGVLSATSERREPLRVALLDDRQTRELLDGVQPPLQREGAPRVVTISGTTAIICSNQEQPFVVGMRGNPGAGEQPQLRVVRTGWAMLVRSLAQKNGGTRLTCAMEFSDIRDVDTVSLPRGESTEPASIQVPNVVKSRAMLAYDVPAGKSLLIDGLIREDGAGNRRSMLVLLRSSKFSTTAPPQTPVRPAPPLPPLPGRSTSGPQVLPWDPSRTAASPPVAIANPLAAETGPPAIPFASAAEQSRILAGLTTLGYQIQPLEAAIVHENAEETSMQARHWSLVVKGQDDAHEYRITAEQGWVRIHRGKAAHSVDFLLSGGVLVQCAEWEARADLIKLKAPMIVLTGHVQLQHRSGIAASAERVDLDLSRDQLNIHGLGPHLAP